jgi:hypothetical protein
MLLAVVAAASPAAAAAPAKAATPNIWGVWMGVGGGRPDIDKRWRNTSFLPKPEFTAWGAAESKRLGGGQTPGQCDVWSPVSFMNAGGLFPLQILDGGNQIVMMEEAVMQPRRIYTDGRGHPPDLDSTWLGHSIGHWEGDTLVIDTIGFNGRERPMNGYESGAVNSPDERADPRLPVSTDLHLVERMRLVGGGEFLELEMIMTDPKTYLHPFTTKRYFQRRPDIDVQEYTCVGNDRIEDEGQAPRPH